MSPLGLALGRGAGWGLRENLPWGPLLGSGNVGGVADLPGNWRRAGGRGGGARPPSGAPRAQGGGVWVAASPPHGAAPLALT